MNQLDMWALQLICDYSPDQPRDETGKWTSGGIDLSDIEKEYDLLRAQVSSSQNKGKRVSNLNKAVNRKIEILTTSLNAVESGTATTETPFAWKGKEEIKQALYKLRRIKYHLTRNPIF